MAKEPVNAARKYSVADLYLIGLLAKPLKRPHSKKPTEMKMKHSDELLRSVIFNELISDLPLIPSPTT